MRTAYQRIINLSVVYCGLHLDGKREKMSKEVIEEIQEERIKNLLFIEMAEKETTWEYDWYHDKEIVLCEVAGSIESMILEELLREITAIH